MSKVNWSDVTRENVLNAIEEYNSNPQAYPKARNTFLMFKRKKYPAKAIRGLAYKNATNYEISSEEYSGGKPTVSFLTNLGFSVVYKDIVFSGKKAAKKPKLNSKDVKQTGKAVIKNTSKADKTIDPVQVIKKGMSRLDATAQKVAFQNLLNQYYIKDKGIVSEMDFDWLRAPKKLDRLYAKIMNALSDYRGYKEFVKPNIKLKCDYVCAEQKVIFEYDERQHFSEARRISLVAYGKQIPTDYDRNLWIKACESIQAKDRNPNPQRDEGRAFYDSVRDIEAARNGYKLIRVMHGQFDWTSPDALEELKRLLAYKESR